MEALNLNLKPNFPSALIGRKIQAKQVHLKIVVPSKAKKSNKLDQDLVEELILTHRPSARKLSRSLLRAWRARLDLQELDSLVDLALCEAASRFNPRKGASFMTFLYYHLRGFLIKFIKESLKNSNMLVNYNDLEEGQAESNSASKVTNFNDVAQALCNFDQPLPDEIVYRNEVSKISNQACAKLDNLEKEVVYRLFVLEQSVIDIADTLNYSRCHVSRIKKKVLKQLQSDLNGALNDGSEELPEIEEESEESRRLAPRKRKRRKEISSSHLRNGARKLLAVN